MSENSLYSLRWIKVVEALFEKLLQSVLHDILYLFKQLFDLGTNSLSFREEDSHSLVCSIVRFHVLLFQTWRGNRIMSWNAVRSHLSSKSLLKFKVTLHWKGGLIGGNLNACSQGSLQAYYIYHREHHSCSSAGQEGFDLTFTVWSAWRVLWVLFIRDWKNLETCYNF